VNNQIEVPSANRAGQSTQIEQARAMAQVHAMMRMAQEFPRDPRLVWTRMEDACGQMELAERAFYRFPRGDGQQVSGASVHLARELARCWGNVDFGVSELARDDYKGESEMLAQAWDIETCIRSYATFIVPHKRDKGNKSMPLLTMRDIYESNANAGARRLREAIFAVLPLRFCLEAQKLCTKTLEDKNSAVPMHERVEELVNWYAKKGVKSDQLKDKVGKPVGQWAAGDLALLRVIMHSLHAHETTIELEFPTVFTRAEDIAGPVAEVETKPGVPVKTEQWSEMTEATPAPVVPAGYVCDVCGVTGKHFQDVCPTLQDDSE
jgi:hypothetical protein